MEKLRAEVEAKRNDEDAKREAEEREAKMRIEMELKMKADQEEAIRKQKEREEKIAQEEAAIKLRQAEQSALEQQLEQIMPMIREANMIAAEFKREVRFNSHLTSVMPDFDTMKDRKRVFQIKIDNNEDKYFYIWDPDKFVNRIELMRALLENFIETGQIPDFTDKDHDPFWDPPEPQLIGQSYLQLKNLGYTIELDE